MATTTIMYVGDLDPTYTTQLLEPDGVTPVNLTGLTGSNIVLKWQSQTSAATTGAGVVTIVTPATGSISYAWASGDTATANTYTLWAEVTFAGNKPQHCNLGMLSILAAP